MAKKAASNKEPFHAGQAVASIMQKQGISQAELAKKLGVTPPSVTLLLLRKTHRMDTVLKLCAALKVSPQEIYPQLTKAVD